MKPGTTVQQTADTLVQQHLDRIIAAVTENNNLRAVILMGAFGRGEGSFAYLNGHLQPLNDYGGNGL